MMNFSKEKGSGAREGGEKSVGLGRESISKADNSRDKGKGLGRENIIERKTVSKGSIGVNIGREIKSISKKIVGETQGIILVFISITALLQSQNHSVTLMLPIHCGIC